MGAKRKKDTWEDFVEHNRLHMRVTAFGDHCVSLAADETRMERAREWAMRNFREVMEPSLKELWALRAEIAVYKRALRAVERANKES